MEAAVGPRAVGFPRTAAANKHHGPHAAVAILAVSSSRVCGAGVALLGVLVTW